MEIKYLGDTAWGIKEIALIVVAVYFIVLALTLAFNTRKPKKRKKRKHGGAR